MISKNGYLTFTQMQANAREFYNYMLSNGFNSYAVCAMLGNIESESGINPGIWQNLNYGNLNGGYGLVQWTPASKVINWLEENNYSITDGTGQMQRIIWEKNNNQQWIKTSSYPLTFSEFASFQNNTMSDEECCKYLADAFIKNYERPENQNQPQRGVNAWKWFQFLGAVAPTPNPEPDEPVTPPEPVTIKFEYVYILGNDYAIAVGNEWLFINRYQFNLFNNGVCLRLIEELDPEQKLFVSSGSNVYRVSEG